MTNIQFPKNKKNLLSGGIEPPFRDSESHVITTTLQEIVDFKIYSNRGFSKKKKLVQN